jgi:hypothetical protein
MNKSPNCLKVVLNSGALPVVNNQVFYTHSFSALTEKNDIIYNEFFNYVRQKNLPLKMVLTGCFTGGLLFGNAQNPFYINIVFEGISTKNEIAVSKNAEFLCQTNAVLTFDQAAVLFIARPVVCQYCNLPKSNKNIGVELNDYSVFTTPMTIKMMTSNNNVVEGDAGLGYANQFTIEFWLFVEE